MLMESLKEIRQRLGWAESQVENLLQKMGGTPDADPPTDSALHHVRTARSDLGAHIETAETTGEETTEGGDTPAPDHLIDFSKYADSQELREDTAGTDSTDGTFTSTEDKHLDHIHLDPNEGLNIDGHELPQSMRYDFHQDWGHPQRNTIAPHTWTEHEPEIWLEVYAKFSENFRTDWGVDGKNPDYKWIFGRVWGGGRFQLKTGTFGDTWHLSSPESGDYDRLGSSSDYWDGQWHRYRIHWKHESAEGANDGVSKLWIDDDVVIGSESVGTRVEDASGIYSIGLGRNMNHMSGVSETISLWWGRVAMWWNEDPGW